MNSDFRDLLLLLSEEEVDYLVVGGYAVIYHSQPRSTKDLDIWLRPTKENAHRIARAFSRFGLPFMGGVTVDDFSRPGLQYAIGRPPSMIDFLTSLPDLDFQECWENRVVAKDEGITILFLSKEDLIIAKETAGRAQDIADLEELKRAEP